MLLLHFTASNLSELYYTTVLLRFLAPILIMNLPDPVGTDKLSGPQGQLSFQAS